MSTRSMEMFQGWGLDAAVRSGAINAQARMAITSAVNAPPPAVDDPAVRDWAAALRGLAVLAEGLACWRAGEGGVPRPDFAELQVSSQRLDHLRSHHRICEVGVPWRVRG